MTVRVEESRGAPVTMIHHRATGCRVLLPREREVRLARVMAPYRVGGFHDCFPSVTPYQYRGQFGVAFIPTFGDVWTRFWSFPKLEDEVVASVTGKPLPYVFKRRITSDGGRVQFEYEVENTGREAFPWLWAGRISLPVEESCRLAIPGCRSVRLVNEAGRQSEETDWPVGRVEGRGRTDLSRPVTEGRAVKFFVNAPAADQLAVELPRTHARVVICWDTGARRTFGVQFSGGEWPGGFVEPIQFMTVEPTTTPHEDLDEAIEAGEVDVLEPGRPTRFSFSIEVKPPGS